MYLYGECFEYACELKGSLRQAQSPVQEPGQVWCGLVLSATYRTFSGSKGHAP